MSSAVKEHIISSEQSHLSAYKKLPPIHSTQKMTARQVISPTSISVDFSPPDSAQQPNKQLSGGKVTVRKTSAELNKSNSAKLNGPHIGNQGTSTSSNLGNKRMSPLGVGGKPRSSEVASGPVTTGIELIGYKMTNSHTMASSDKVAVPQQAGDWTPLSSELPPCRVCGDKASGLHYGVNTCEACKAFFRRTLKKSAVNFQCTCTEEEKLLGTDQPRKTTCPKCRYERCLKTGMSKDAIKIGRYTISRKRQNDHEVKTLKQGETTPGVQRLSESSKSTSSNSPYSTSQSVSSPEELSSDITSLSLQENKPAQTGKKRRHDEEVGLLYQSLTNSIFMSLLNNKQDEEQLQTSENSPQQTTQNSPPVKEAESSMRQAVSDVTPMEKLLISNSQDSTETSNTDFGTDLSVVDPQMSSYEQDDDFSPMAQILSTYDQTMVDSSPVEQLLMESSIVNPEISLPTSFPTGIDSNGQLQFQQSLSGNIDMPFSTASGVEGETNSSGIIIGSNPSLYGINDGSHIQTNENSQPASTDIIEESPIENLLTAPSQTKPYSTILTVTYNNMLSNLTNGPNVKQTNNYTSQGEQNSVMYNGQQNPFQVVPAKEIPVNNTVDALGGNAFTASKLSSNEQQTDSECGDFVTGDFDTGGFDEGDFVEDPEEIEIQTMQLYRFENPLIRVGQGISFEEATNIIMTLGKAAGVLFDNTKKMTCEEIKKRHAEYLEQYMLKTQLFGDMSNISKEEYLEFYNQTGIDIDNRQQILIEALKYMEESIAKLVTFAKSIPGFSDIDIDDQVNLVKASLIEFGCIIPGDTPECQLSESNVATMPWDQDYHLNELLKFFPAELFELKKEILEEIRDIYLSVEEATVLRAVVVTALDRCVLKEPQKVEYLHNRLIACFLFMLGSRPPEKLVTVQAILGTLFKIRQLAWWDTQIIQEMFEVWPVTSNHQLVKEFVT